jgi:protease IV
MKQFLKYALASMLGVIVAFTLLFLILIGIGSSLSQKESSVQIQENSVLKISLNGVILEQSVDNPFNFNIPGIPMDTRNLSQGLDDLMGSIDKAGKNPNIKGIYLECGALETGWSTAEEIRNALLRFKKSGKFILAYGEMMDQKEYFICSAADSLFLNPEGMINFAGLAATPIFYKETLDKIGVKAEIFKVGTFKSAVEPYINTKMSDANKLQTQSFLNEMWNHVLNQVSKSRKISVEALQDLADSNTLFESATNLVHYKLADSLMYETDMVRYLNAKAGVKEDKDAQLLTPTDVIKSIDNGDVEAQKIAILYAEGEIFDSGSEGIVAKELIKDIKKIQKDSLIKSVVLRVNSPGGSAYASEQIWKAISDLKKIKPVVVSMGDYAASGGYYISSGASKIVASPNTLTGSIGIFGMYFIMDELAQKIGLNFDVVKTNELSDFGNLTRPMTTIEKFKVQNYVNRGYDLFVKRCAEGRNIKDADIRKIAEGRVWTGSQALKNGLVDEIGGLDKAIALASKMGKVDKYRLVQYPEKKDFMTLLMEEMSSDSQLRFAKWVLGEDFAPLLKLKQAKMQTGIIAKMVPIDIN